jgi:hypothetical protein
MADATYSLEQFIDWLIEAAEYEHDQSFEELKLTKLELATLCAQTVDALGRSECRWCGVDTGEIHEWYMVSDEIWDRYGPANRCLCIGCLEDRLGRRLQPEDFKDVPVNSDTDRHRSDRLLNRLGLDQPALFDACVGSAR